MIRLDDKLLEEVGLGRLPGDLRKPMLQHIYDTLETRVGLTLAGRMTDSQLEDFERISNAEDESKGLAWLQENMPEYKEVVGDEFEKLKVDIRSSATEILRSEGIEPGSPTTVDVSGDAE
jgi:hypothetical protein